MTEPRILAWYENQLSAGEAVQMCLWADVSLLAYFCLWFSLLIDMLCQALHSASPSLSHSFRWHLPQNKDSLQGGNRICTISLFRIWPSESHSWNDFAWFWQCLVLVCAFCNGHDRIFKKLSFFELIIKKYGHIWIQKLMWCWNVRGGIAENTMGQGERKCPR